MTPDQIMKITITQKELERVRSEVLSVYAQSRETLTVLTLREFTRILKTKGVNIEVEVEEVCVSDSDD